ncbi:MAG: cbb3-type cytochrome c oxidase subunit 3 [Candidatus Uhrbacteria bacterium]|nr:cbb3-type cytochrome c oxidase subunit 3 [Candidatus Uhrbacteria bacterium]
MKKWLIVLFVVLLGVIVYLFVKLDEARNMAPVADDGGSDEEMCIQVITRAENVVTGEEREFATPCDVPTGEGWRICNATPVMAVYPPTGEEREFPSECDMPEGWYRRPTTEDVVE